MPVGAVSVLVPYIGVKSISLPRSRVVSTPSMGSRYVRAPIVNDSAMLTESCSNSSVVLPVGGETMIIVPRISG